MSGHSRWRPLSLRSSDCSLAKFPMAADRHRTKVSRVICTVQLSASVNTDVPSGIITMLFEGKYLQMERKKDTQC